MTIKDRAEAAMNALLRAAKDEPKLLECNMEVLEDLVFTLMGVRVSWEEGVSANRPVDGRTPLERLIDGATPVRLGPDHPMTKAFEERYNADKETPNGD